MMKDCTSAAYGFCQGTNFAAYDYLGCHRIEKGNKPGYVFRVWAPSASAVCVVGDAFGWEGGLSMTVTDGGTWEAYFETDGELEGSFYKYAVTNGETVLKSDPYATMSETLGKTASVIHTLRDYGWGDDAWLRHRRDIFASSAGTGHFYPAPMNIYELNLGSWRTRDEQPNTDGFHYLNYREIADMLCPYVKKMGYTHVELMPVAEHPFDGSWGYQVTGYYAPTSRYGTPEDFKYFVDTLHRNGVGVILDWVPAHFPRDRAGLFEFDGSSLYEYEQPDKREHAGWGTHFFDVGRPEVQCFLISNALYWFRLFHIDGLRADAVASMLYLDYDKKDGEWTPNADGGNHNYEAEEFFRKLNRAVFGEFSDVLMIAEESTAWPMVTHPVSAGGLGFNFKWNMGFSNDMFEYMSADPISRQYMHDRLTFPMMYAFSENFILPVSHDEVVHSKRSLVDKMYGDYDEKFASMRAFLSFVMTMPGKKLMFMGCEFAQFREWDYENQLEWFMLGYPRHAEMQRFVSALNCLYLERSELWEIDDSWAGFEWIFADRREDNVVAYRRWNTSGECVVVVINFSPVDREDYELPVREAGRYRVLINSDLYAFGGRNVFSDEYIEGDSSLSLTLAKYTALIIKKEAGNNITKGTRHV